MRARCARAAIIRRRNRITAFDSTSITSHQEPHMRLRPSLFLLLLCSLPFSARSVQAADASPCGAEVRHQFDFWIGDWSVTEHGKAAGTNRIDRLLDGCALLENWVGAGGGRGHSLNFYDPRRALWQQTWVDATGGSLNLTGQFSDG
ncbi:MAG: hypothetical protein JSR15_13245, partial [Proteobacteria bacterium]|nr:hypothetical protein [Pseudomonadota bacterium]